MTYRTEEEHPRGAEVTAPAILFSQMEPPAALEDEFGEWYDEEHIPIRLAAPGFQAASRWEAIDGTPRYLAVYELEDLGALKTPEYVRIKAEPSERTARMLGAVSGFTRFTCPQISDAGDPEARGTYMAVVSFAVPEDRLGDFDDWYENEHVPALLQADDWLRVRRYEVLDGEGGPWNRFALHELASREVMDSPERAAARKGPKRDALAASPWFDGSGRWLYQRIRYFQA